MGINYPKGGEVAKAVLPVAAVPAPLSPRLNIGDMLHLLRISRTKLYEGIESGQYPKPDGKDGRMPYWFAESVRYLVEKQK